MEPISSALAVEQPKPYITDVAGARAFVSTVQRVSPEESYWETYIVSGEYDGTGWKNSTESSAMLVHRLVVAALTSGRPLPEGGERG